MMFFNLVFMSCGKKQNYHNNNYKWLQIHLIKKLYTKAVLRKEGSIKFRALEILSAHAASVAVYYTIEIN